MTKQQLYHLLFKQALSFRMVHQECRSAGFKRCSPNHVAHHQNYPASVNGYAILPRNLSDVLLASYRLSLGKVLDVHSHVMV